MTTGDDGTRLTPEQRFGAAVRQAREEHGWTQAELARQLSSFYQDGYSHSTVAKTEAGSRPVRLNEASAYASILRRDLALMVRAPGPYNDLAEQLKTIHAKMREVDRQRKDLTGEKARLEAEAEDVRMRLEWLDRNEQQRADRAKGADGGVDREEA